MLFAFGKQFFCEQPLVDAFKVKIKEDGEHFSENCRFPIFLNMILPSIFLYVIYIFKNNFMVSNPWNVPNFFCKIINSFNFPFKLFAYWKHLFCEQPLVDAFRVKIKRYGEQLNFQKVAGFHFLLNMIRF